MQADDEFVATAEECYHLKPVEFGSKSAKRRAATWLQQPDETRDTACARRPFRRALNGKPWPTRSRRWDAWVARRMLCSQPHSGEGCGENERECSQRLQ